MHDLEIFFHFNFVEEIEKLFRGKTAINFSLPVIFKIT